MPRLDQLLGDMIDNVMCKFLWGRNPLMALRLMWRTSKLGQASIILSNTLNAIAYQVISELISIY
jgi:hypothetical protein